MRLFACLVFACCLAASVAPAALARDETPATAVQTLVPFSSEEGLARLVRSGAKVDFPALANQFEPQSNGAFCGPTTTAIVLNTVRGRSADLPRDRSRLRPEDFTFAPPGFDPSVPRFTQDNVIGKGLKTRSQVLGEPVVINGKQTRDFGYQLRQLDELLRAHQLVTRLVITDDKQADVDIRRDLIQNLQRSGDYVIVNYRRVEVGQTGGGHISPLGAFDAESDSVLVLDVNPASAGWVWMPVASLIRGMRTFDTVEYRGYILVQSR